MAAVTQLIPNFLGGVSRQNDDKKLEGTVTNYCDRNDLLLELDELLVIEYYSRR